MIEKTQKTPVISGVYSLTNTINGKMYIGQAIDIHKRVRNHFSCAAHGDTRCTAIYNAIRFYGKNAFVAAIIEECEVCDLDEKEIYWIDSGGTIAPLGYNLKTGGCTPVFSEELKTNISRGVKATFTNGRTPWNKGLPRTVETRDKISKALKGGHISEATKKKISRGMKGRICTWGDKISRAVAMTKLKGQLIACSNGSVYSSITEAAIATGCHRSGVSAMIAGGLKTTGGLTFKKVDPSYVV